MAEQALSAHEAQRKTGGTGERVEVAAVKKSGRRGLRASKVTPVVPRQTVGQLPLQVRLGLSPRLAHALNAFPRREILRRLHQAEPQGCTVQHLQEQNNGAADSLDVDREVAVLSECGVVEVATDHPRAETADLVLRSRIYSDRLALAVLVVMEAADIRQAARPAD